MNGTDVSVSPSGRSTVCDASVPDALENVTVMLSVTTGMSRSRAGHSIFSFAEPGFQEKETSKYLTGILEKNGFKVTLAVVVVLVGYLGFRMIKEFRAISRLEDQSRPDGEDRVTPATQPST